MLSRTATIALFTSSVKAVETLVFDEEFKTLDFSRW
jgi:hypothetical protein